MGLVVCLLFLVKGSVAESPVVTISLLLYIFGVVSSYATSTIYHAIPARKVEAKALARKFDHAAIYWHIAGSYSPVTLIGMMGGGEKKAANQKHVPPLGFGGLGPGACLPE